MILNLNHMTKYLFNHIISIMMVCLLGCGSAFADSSLVVHNVDSADGWAEKAEHSAKPKKLKHLAIINSYNENTTWPRKFINSIISEMSLHDDFGPVKVAHLNNSIIYDEEDYAELQTRFFEFFANQKPDYLVLIGTFAFTLRDQIKEHWGDIPMLLICQNDRVAPLSYYFTTTNNDVTQTPPRMSPMADLQKDFNFTAVMTLNTHRETIDMMMEMYPELEKIVFMGDGTFANRHISYLIYEYLKLKYSDVKLEWLLASNEGVMLPYLNNMDPKMGLLLSSWSYSQPGLNGQPLFTAGDSYLIKAARRPVFGLRYSYFNYGILGGYFSDVNEFIGLVMEGLSNLIADKRMSEIPFTEITNSVPYINYPKLLELGISEGKCPPSTIYYNRQESAWQSYKSYIMAGIIAGGIVILLLIVYILTRRRPIFRRDYDDLVNSIPLGFMQILVVLDKDGKVTKVEYSEQNRALKEIIEEYQLRSLIKDTKYLNWQKTVDAIRSENKPRNVVVHVPGTETYFDFIITPDKHSTETYFLANIFVIDVSDKMKIENVLRDAAKKAIEADNMKSNFLANMSHEIRTPLNAIVGFSHLLCRTNDRKKMDQFIEIIETNNQLLLKLIGDVLDISKADANKLVFNMQTVDVNSIINSVCRSADLSQRPDVSLNTQPGMEKCLVTTDPYRINQVLTNLLTNAIKFTERGHIEVGYTLEDKMLRFYVKDTGLGLSENDKTKLFTRFTKLNSFIQGTGLGLSISKAIVENLGGKIKAESEGRGKGSTFSFTIPYVLKDVPSEPVQDVNRKSDEERLADLKKKVNAQSTEYGNIILPHVKTEETFKPTEHKNLSSYKREKKKILIVEDNTSNYMLLEAMIDGRYELVHAWDGEEAVRMFAKETPDLILMDINLPHKNGYEATSEIRLISKTVPVIAVTAYAQDTDKEKIIACGFNGYIAKPIAETDLFRILKQFL